jgi:hypothetical protein
MLIVHGEQGNSEGRPPGRVRPLFLIGPCPWVSSSRKPPHRATCAQVLRLSTGFPRKVLSSSTARKSTRHVHHGVHGGHTPCRGASQCSSQALRWNTSFPHQEKFQEMHHSHIVLNYSPKVPRIVSLPCKVVSSSSTPAQCTLASVARGG